MKKFLSLVLAAAMVFAMTACGGSNSSSSTPAAGGSSAATSGASGEKVKIGLSIAGLTMPYYVRMYDGFMEAAEKEGYEVVFADGGAFLLYTSRCVEETG